MKILINSINTLSAGTKGITDNVLNALGEYNSITYVGDVIKSSKRVRSIPFSSGRVKFFTRILFELYFSIFSYIYKPSKVLIFANYSPLPCYGKKYILVRNPYLVDKEANEELFLIKDKLLEFLRRTVFKLSIKTADTILVQSTYMENKLYEVYSIPEHVRVSVLANPVSESMVNFSNKVKVISPEGLKLIYPSRYYPHKNHLFILKFARSHYEELVIKKVRIYITLTKSAVNSFLFDLLAEVSSVVINLGEIPQNSLFEEYLTKDVLFFPSISETFGNSLIEAGCFGLPIIVNDKPYARAVCDEGSTSFIVMNETDKSYKRLMTTIDAFLLKKSSASVDFFCRPKIALTPSAWIKAFIGE